MLDKLNDAFKTKRPHSAKKKMLFLQNNTPAHTSSIAVAKLHEIRFQLVPYALYLLDLAPSDFFQTWKYIIQRWYIKVKILLEKMYWAEEDYIKN